MIVKNSIELLIATPSLHLLIQILVNDNVAISYTNAYMY